MRKLPIIGAASLALIGAAAFAVQGMPDAVGKKMDSDGNGLVSKAEAMTAADAMFAKMDANGDGTVNPADREAKIKTHFQEMDADKNGSISETEFMAAHKDRMEDRQAKRADGDHRGKGRHNGHHGGMGGGGHGMAMMKAADTNNDMAVSKAEFRTAAETRFTASDANKDGSLSADEQKAARKAMRGPHGDHGGMKPAAAD
jgi:EF hand